jgi:hypothetical protein
VAAYKEYKALRPQMRLVDVAASIKQGRPAHTLEDGEEFQRPKTAILVSA